jgi:hypothetical protein
VDLNNLRIVNEKYLKLRQGIYDMVILPDDYHTILVCQHFGYVEMIDPSLGQVL